MANVIKIPAKVSLHKLFREISRELGFSDEDIDNYAMDVFELLDKWEQQGFVEVYENYSDRKVGRLKRSDLGKYAIPWYLEPYHARISEKNDPLIVLRKDNEDQRGEYSFSVRFLITHDKMFGSLNEKNNEAILKKIKMTVDTLIKKGNY